MNPTTLTKYELLIKHYGNKYTNFDLFFQNYEGLFVFSRIDIVFNVLQTLLDMNFISIDSTFVETGSGDGRIVALASILGFKSYGIELSNDMANISIDHLNQLKKENIITKDNSAKIIQGDFLQNETYSKIDHLFNEIDIFFNYYTNTELITSKIEKEAKIGCILVSVSLSKKAVKTSMDVIYSTSLPDRNHHLFVYKKQN